MAIEEFVLKRFDSIALDGRHLECYVYWNKKCEEILTGLESSLGPSRERSIAITKLEEFAMWIGKAIKEDQRFCQGGLEGSGEA